MLRLMVNLKRLKESVIYQGYPVLKNFKITSKWGELDMDALFEFAWVYDPKKGLGVFSPPKKFQILVDHNMRYASEKAIKAGIAHEAEHILKDVKFGNLFNLYWLVYQYSRIWRKRAEIEADLGVINRGFGRGLIDLMLFGEELVDSGKKSDSIEGGMTVEQVEYILSANGRLPHPLTYNDYCKIFGSSH